MKFKTAFSASLILFAFACSSGDEFDGLYSGDTTAGWSTNDANTSLRVVEENGGNALGASGTTDPATQTAGFSFAVPPGAASGSVGIEFKIAGTSSVRFSATTSSVVPLDAGGTCSAGADCWDVHGASLTVSAQWQTVTLTWDQLLQSGAGLPVVFNPEELTHLNWEVSGVDAFDIRIDEIRFIDSAGGTTTPIPQGSGGSAATGGSNPVASGGTTPVATGGTTATGGSAATGGSTNTSDHRLGKYVSSSMFATGFNGRNPVYKYSRLLAAVDLFPDFAACCSETEKKREIAAFLAHVQHEADHLAATEEYTPPSIYCQTGQYACAAGKSYHGRGALQLTWNYNYQFAQDWFASQGQNYDLVARPEQVATNEDLLWTTALWFWMEGDPSFFNDTMHDRLSAKGFGSTIDKINGGLECGPGASNPGAVTQRIQYYREWCERLGVDPGSNLTC